MAIRGILFDKDGTLVDFPATWEPVLRALAAEFAPDDAGRAEELLALAGYDPAIGGFRAGSVWAAGHTLDLVRVWAPEADAVRQAELALWVDGFCSRVAPETAAPIGDLRALFDSLAAEGYLLGIATNDSARSATATMERLGLLADLTLVMGYDSVPDPKPGPGPVLLFCEHAGTRPEEIAVVGDNVHDVEMARAAGAGLAIGVLTGNARREHLEDHADYLIQSVEDLPALLAGLGAGREEAACSTTR